MRHLACIMDGNRRWARRHALQSFLGHEHGAHSIKTVVEFCLKKKIPYLSLYTFSIENLNRPEPERLFLFNLINDNAQKYAQEFMRKDVRVQFVGDRSLFPAHVLDAIEYIEQTTKQCASLNLNFLFCYGARQEMIHGIKKMIHDVRQGIINEHDISESMVTSYFWTKNIPDPDLIVRTGGAMRLSNFLLYQAAYSELYFLDCFWPDISEQHLQEACAYFDASQRNFGS